MTLPPEPRANPDLVGHDDPARTLEEAARAGRLHHAWLIAGPPGVGKATLAYRFARWLLAGLPPPVPGRPPLEVAESHPAFRRVAAGAHADQLTVEPGTEQGTRKRADIINVEATRLIPAFMALTPAEGGWRVVVLDVAEAMNRNAANALLKVLEEPPARAILLLTCSELGALLPTIRSRCRRLDLAPLPDAALEGLLARWLPEMSGPDRIGLARIADGCPGQALALAEGEGLELQKLVDQVFAELPRLDPRRLHVIADGVAGRRDAAALTVFFALLRRALAAGLRQAGRGGQAEPWLAGRSLADWSTLWDKLGRLADETERLNLDRKQAVLTGLGWLSTR